MGEAKQGKVYNSVDGEHWECVDESEVGQEEVEQDTTEAVFAQVKEAAEQVRAIIREFLAGVKSGYAAEPEPEPRLDHPEIIDSTARSLD